MKFWSIVYKTFTWTNFQENLNYKINQHHDSKKGNPKVYEFYDVHSKEYLRAVIKDICPKAKIKIIKDTYFSTKKINNKNEKKLNKTKVINGMQVADLLILPHHFVIIKKN